MSSQIASCQANQCQWNQNQDCQAPKGVTVNMHQDHADCETFEPQQMSGQV